MSVVERCCDIISTDHGNKANNVADVLSIDWKIVEFDVGGRIFKVSRSLLESFPETTLARAASDLWNSTSSAPVGTAATKTTGNVVAKLSSVMLPSTASNNKKSIDLQFQHKQHPIFIERDSNCFSYVLDYMRDGCVVVLPVTISKESFINDLQYYGFEESTINNNSSITCTVPTYESFMQVQHLHANFITMMQQNVRERDYGILSYACFCECIFNNTLICTFSLICTSNAKHYKLFVPTIIGPIVGSSKFPIASIDALNVGSLVAEYKEKERKTHGDHTKSPSTDDFNGISAILFFNNCLAEYGLQFTSIDTGSSCLKIHLKPIDCSTN